MMCGRAALTGVKKNTHTVLMRKPEGKITLGNSDVNKRIILKWIFKKFFGGGGGGLAQIHLTEGRENWRVVLCMIMNI